MASPSRAMLRCGRLLIAPAAITLVANCVPNYSATGSPNDSGADAYHDATNGGGDASDGHGGGLPDLSIRTVLPSVGIPTNSGNAQQQHLVFATNSARYWLFYYDADPRSLKTQWSTDFVNWTAGATLTLPMNHGGEARNLAVAYGAFGTTDVVHIATALHDAPNRVVYETRATITGASITFGTPIEVHDLNDAAQLDAGGQFIDDTGCDPDGTGIAIGADGHVYVTTSWVQVPGCCACDANVFVSSGVEQGTGGIGTFPFTSYKHYTVGGTSHAHEVVGFSTGNMLANWDYASDPQNDVGWGAQQQGVWTPDEYDKVFLQTTWQAPNDWSTCRIDDSRVYTLHRRENAPVDAGTSGAGPSSIFEFYQWSGAGYTFVTTLPEDPGFEGSGVVLLTNGKSLLAATISSDAVGHVRYATYDGASWSAWANVPGGPMFAVGRNFISGTSCDDPQHPVLLWAEGATPPYKVLGMQVTALFP